MEAPRPLWASYPPASIRMAGLGLFEGPGVSLVQWRREMLKWAAIFLVIAMIAALLGFTGVAGAATEVARFLFFLFIAIFVIVFLLAIFAGKKMF